MRGRGAADPLAATASTDGATQALATRLATHFGHLTAETLSEAVPGALQLLAAYADVDIVFAVLVDHDRLVDVWEWAEPGRTTAPPPAGWSVDRAFGPAAQVLRRGIAIPVPDARLLTLDAESTERFRRADVGSIALVPIRRRDELVGVVGLVTCGRSREWSTRVITHLDVFGDMLLTAVLRVRYHADLAVADARVRRIADLLPDALLFVADDGRVTWASRAAERVLGRAPGDVVGCRPSDLMHADDRPGVRRAARLARRGRTLPPVRCRLAVGGEYRWCEVTFSYATARPEAPGDGAVTAPPELLVSIRDTHESALEAERLASSATTDHLTGALNRTGLAELLDELSRRGVPLALAFCDLDGFKQVNDRHGHRTGDDVLVEVAARLRRASRPDDALARLGGDEFVAVLPGVADLAGAGRLAERLVRSIAGPEGELALPTADGVLRVPLSLSVGVALCAPGRSCDEALQLADGAMYEAKRRGKNRWVTVPS